MVVKAEHLRPLVNATLLFASCLPIIGRELNPAGDFELAKVTPADARPNPLFVKAFIARATGLYYLVSPTMYGDSGTTILRTDETGRYQGVIRLKQELGKTEAIEVDQSGEILALCGDRKQVARYRPDGTLVMSMALSRPALSIAVVNGVPTVLSYDGTLVALSGEPGSAFSRVRLPEDSMVTLASLPGSGFVVVKGYQAELDFGTATGQQLQSVALSGKEIERSRAFYGRRGGLLRGVAVTTDGRIYLNLFGHNALREGAMVLQADMSGIIRDTLQCLLPKAEVNKTQGNTDGYLFPSFVATKGSALFIASRTGHVGYYFP